MLPLDDPWWSRYTGGYQVVYDASQALQRLFDGGTAEAIEELENELCHQGDLGSAAYAAAPWLVEYLRRGPELDARVAGLVLTIEFDRLFNGDKMPEELRRSYERAIGDLPEIVLSKRTGRWDDRQVQVAASVLALSQGNRWFARTYFELDRAILSDWIAQAFGSADWNWPG